MLDFSQFMAGPAAAQKLGDYGAEVVKIERPGVGEGSRHSSAANYWVDGKRSAFVALNRNKRSLTLDLKKEEGREVALGLARGADVLIENFRPGVMERLGLGYGKLREVNPRLVYGSITGYGPEGPYRDFPGQDLLVQCLSGIANLNGRDVDPPTPIGMPIIDAVTGQQLAFGIVSALLWREKTGEGQRVEVSLLDTAIDLQAQEFTIFLNSGEEPRRSATGIAHPYFIPPYGIYATKDGYIALAHTPFDKLSEHLGIPFLSRYESRDAAFRDRDGVYQMVASAIQERTTKEWLTYLRAHDFWCGPVRGYRELAEDEQVAVNGMIVEVEGEDGGVVRLPGVPIKFGETPGSVRAAPPGLGEHTDEVLAQAGLSAEDVANLRDKGVV